jgi:hypothetical protein
MKSCKDITLLIEKSKDEKLSFKERMQIKLHTKMCKFCHNYSLDSEFMDKLLSRLKPKSLVLSSEEKSELARKVKKQL